MRYRRIAILAAVFLAAAFAGKKKDSDDDTQVLELPKEPPMVAIGVTDRLTFQVSPLSAKGLLTQQTHDALKAILKMNGGAPVIHIRAFVAGNGDLRRVPQIVSEVFTAKKMALPSVSVVLAGGLPLADAQVVIEAVSEARKAVNETGLSFVEAVAPNQLGARLAGSAPLKVTCFLSSLESAGATARLFPSVTVDIVQTQRTPARADERCEAVVRGGKTAPRLAFTGTQIAFGTEEKAAALAFQRLDHELSSAGASTPDILEAHVYAISERLGELARKVHAGPGPLTVLPFEGVASVDGSFAIDSIAGVR